MADRPDQPCNKCRRPIAASDDGWTSAGRYVFHDDCFACSRCKNELEEDQWVEKRGVLTCTACVAKAEEKAAPFRDPSAARLTVRCVACEKSSLSGKIMTTAQGHNWCLDCYRCANCRRDILGTECFELLDELFCVNCELPYRNKRYLIRKMGGGEEALRDFHTQLQKSRT